ncbi:MAG TPA: OsmC family protein [Ktedonobacteraceae bacterium]|jgi:putative redox protein|nr:OsmC family protein [Ktedonobacteraceae bacterium]
MAKAMSIQATYQTGMQFDVTSGSGHHVIVDNVILPGDQHVGFSPMEMLLVALAGCTGINVISILQKKQQQVTAYEMRVNGILTEQFPKIFVEISVEHFITGPHVKPEAVARAIELSETRYCGVSIMLSKTAKINHTFQIREIAQQSNLPGGQ